MNWSLEFGPDTVSLEVQIFADEAVLNSIEIPLAVWNLLESQRLRILEDALSGAPLTEDEQARPYEAHEQANVPNLLPNRAMRQDAIRGWEGQETVIDNGSTTDSGIGTISPGTSTTTDTRNVSPSIFDLAIDRYGFDYPVWIDNSEDDVDVLGQEHFDDDREDQEDKNTTPAGDHDDDHKQPQRLRRSNEVPFQRIENIPDSVIRSLFQQCLQHFSHHRTNSLIPLNIQRSVFLNSTFRNCFFFIPRNVLVR